MKASHVDRGLRLAGTIALALVVDVTLAAAQPANDDCSAAQVIAVLPFAGLVDTTLATAGGSDPVSSCGNTENNVWYSYTAAKAVSLSIGATGAAYDANVNVYSGSCTAPVEAGCNHDTPTVANDSLVIVSLQKGESVLVSVADTFGPGGGPVTVSIEEAEPPYFAPPVLTEAVSSTDVSPLGGSFGGFEATVALDKKNVAFVGRNEGVFLESAGTLTTIAVSGDASPAGGTFHTFGKPSINDAGEVAFFASVEGGTADSGIFIYDGGVITAFALEGGASPDGGTFETFRRNVVLESGAMAYLAQTSMSAGNDRLFTTDFLISTVMATEDDLSPCGATIRRIGFAGVNSRGFDTDSTGANAVFYVQASAGGEDGFVHSDGVTLIAVACEDAVSPVGGTYRSPGDQPAITDAGDVYYYFGVNGGPIPEAIWKWNAGIAAPEIAPGTVLGSGETVSDLNGNWFIAATTPGHVALTLEVGGSTRAVVLGGLGVPTALALENDPCPFGGSYDVVDTFVGVSSGGDVSYGAACGGGVGTLHVPFGGAETASADGADATVIGTGFDFADPTINAAGDVAFRGTRLASYAIECKDGVCGAITSGVTPQTAVPGGSGQTIHALRGASFNGTKKEQAFIATTTGPGGYLQAVLGVSEGALVLHALEGDTLPGGSGTYSFFTSEEPQPSQGKGTVAFRADISGHPTASHGLFATTKTGIVTLALDGDLSPTGGTFQSLGVPTARGKSIVFRATTDLDDCIYATKKAGMALTVVACDGDAAPPSLGGGLLTLEGPAPTGSAKSVAFLVNDCLAVATSKGISPVRCVDDPFMRGEFIDSLGSGGVIPLDGPRAEAKAKGLLFSVDTTSSVGLALVAERKGELFPVLEEGLTVAPTSGGTLGADNVSFPTMSKKTVAFGAGIFGGTARAGVFLAEID